MVALEVSVVPKFLGKTNLFTKHVKKEKFNALPKEENGVELLDQKMDANNKDVALKKSRNAKTVYKRCSLGREICNSKRRFKCFRRRYNNCHIKSCFRYTWSFRSNRWRINKRHSKYYKTCQNRKIRCQWHRLKNNCAQRHCIKTFFPQQKSIQN